jgi:pimeloyl-ACP methyl ester carboxylesterase
MHRSDRRGGFAVVRQLILAISGLLALSTAAPVAAASAPLRHESCVILLHGLWRTEYSMKYLEWGLSEMEFEVVNLTYPSLSHPIEELAVMAVEEGLAGCRDLGLQRIHFVTHSLGGILVRQYLRYRGIAGLHRVVMLGPPSQGSQVADFVDGIDILEPITPRAVEQLGTGADSIPLRLGPADFELGIIAGTANRRGMLPGVPEQPGDGTVTVAETIVPGMLDFLELPVSHTFMMWDRRVLHQVAHFLEQGYFDRRD